MKVAVFSESAADEAVYRVLVEALLGEATEAAGFPVAARGWPSVRDDLCRVIPALHYGIEAEGLVIVADSNHSPLHEPEHDKIAGGYPKCRLCELRGEVAKARSRLNPVAGRAVLKIAVGLAVPAMEAWLRCKRGSNVSEVAWGRGFAEKKFPYTKNGLKRDVYGTDRPSLVLETERGTEEARRLAGQMELLEAKFPIGFGSLARDVRGWRES